MTPRLSIQFDRPLDATLIRARSAPPTALDSFASVLGRVESREEAATRAAEEMVTAAFVKPLLSMLENDPLKSGLFGETPGEQAFRPLLNEELARRVVQSARLPIVKVVASDLLREGPVRANA